MYKVFAISAILPWYEGTSAFLLPALCFLNKIQFYNKLLEVCCIKLTKFRIYVHKKICLPYFRQQRASLPLLLVLYYNYS